MSEIIAKVKTLLQKKGFNPINSPNDDEVIQLVNLNGKNGGTFNVHFYGKDASKDNYAFLLATTPFPIKVPLNKRERIISFINEVNKDSFFTWLAFYMDSGEIICRSSNRSQSNDGINDDSLEPILFSSIGRIDALQPFIMDLIYSEKTLDAVIKESKLIN